MPLEVDQRHAGKPLDPRATDPEIRSPLPAQMSETSDTHVFTVLLQVAGASRPEEYAKRAYGDDALQDLLLGGPDSSGVFEADFEREAPSFEEAILSAVEDLARVFPEAQILRTEPDDLVTVAAIAARLGRSHESVRLLARNKRGPGGFPAPAGNLDAKTQVWRWHEVAEWLESAVGVQAPETEHAAFIATLNDILDLRRVAPRAIDRPQLARAMASLLPGELTSAA